LRTAAGCHRQPGIAPRQWQNAQRPGWRAKDSVLEKWVKEKVGNEDAIRKVFLLALGREPTPKELQN